MVDRARPAPARPDGASPADLPLDVLREERMGARRQLELVQLRMGSTAPEADELRARIAVLTDALIARYAADLSLVDSLLEPAYPRGVRTSPREPR